MLGAIAEISIYGKVLPLHKEGSNYYLKMRLPNQNEHSAEQRYLYIPWCLWKLNGCIRDILLNLFVQIAIQQGEEFEKTMLKMLQFFQHTSRRDTNWAQLLTPPSGNLREICHLFSFFQKIAKCTHRYIMKPMPLYE